MNDYVPSAEDVIVFGGSQTRAPDLRLMHYNDVYHVDSSSSEPVGGIARFISLCKYYRSDERFKEQPGLVTFFSGDAFNPSLESSVTKGMQDLLKKNMQWTDLKARKSRGAIFECNRYKCSLHWCKFGAVKELGIYRKC